MRPSQEGFSSRGFLLLFASSGSLVGLFSLVDVCLSRYDFFIRWLVVFYGAVRSGFSKGASAYDSASPSQLSDRCAGF